MREKAKALRGRRQPAVIWLHGPTGCGKSRAAFEVAGRDAFFKDGRSQYWNFYEGELAVVMDEMPFIGDCNYPISEFLQWLDRYCAPLNCKLEAPVPMLAALIIVTSNLSPQSALDGVAAEHKAAALRRIKLTIDCSDGDHREIVERMKAFLAEDDTEEE